MSAAAVVMIVEGVLLGVAILFVVALLRSHAEILRRLTTIEEGIPPVRRASRPGSSGGPASAPEVSARDIVGETLAGDAVKLAFGVGLPPTLLAFLGSGCAACGPLWDGLRDGARGPAGARVVVVTKGPEDESLVRLRSLAPARADSMANARPSPLPAPVMKMTRPFSSPGAGLKSLGIIEVSCERGAARRGPSQNQGPQARQGGAAQALGAERRQHQQMALRGVLATRQRNRRMRIELRGEIGRAHV